MEAHQRDARSWTVMTSACVASWRPTSAPVPSSGTHVPGGLRSTCTRPSSCTAATSWRSSTAGECQALGKRHLHDRPARHPAAAHRRLWLSVRDGSEHMFVTVSPPTPLLKQDGRPPATDSSGTTRHCRHHGWVTFHRYSAGPGKHRWRCKRCVGEAVTRRHQRVKRILVAEAAGGCAVCGYDRTVVNLHFHHVDPAEKAFGVTTASGKSLDAYRAEAAKCVLVCANCHGEIETGLVSSPPPRARFRAA